MEHLEFHGFHHIFSLSKPQNQFITLFDTFGSQPHPVIQVGQFIGPFLPVILGFQFLQHGNALFQTHILGLVQLVLQNITSCVLGSNLHKFFIVFYGHHVVFYLDGEFTEGIYDGPRAGMTVVSQQQYITAVLISAVDFVQVTDSTQHHHALDPAPVYTVRNLRSLLVFSLGNQCLYFICFYLIFIFIQSFLFPAYRRPSLRYCVNTYLDVSHPNFLFPP